MHPYTEALLASVPQIELGDFSPSTPLEGEVPSQVALPPGCPFHPRCPRILGEICRTELPPWQENEFGDRIFCHIPLAELQAVQQAAWERSR
jgi:peptide/nickel transport system ATP-binding protein